MPLCHTDGYMTFGVSLYNPFDKTPEKPSVCDTLLSNHRNPEPVISDSSLSNHDSNLAGYDTIVSVDTLTDITCTYCFLFCNSRSYKYNYH